MGMEEREEFRRLILQQILRGIKFCHLAPVHDHDSITVNNFGKS
jgi:hypothetical protein